MATANKIGRNVRKEQTREVAGSRVGVSGRSIQTATKIKEEAPDLFEQVKEGELSLNAAKNQLAIRTGTQTPAHAIAVAAEALVEAHTSSHRVSWLQDDARHDNPHWNLGLELRPFVNTR